MGPRNDRNNIKFKLTRSVCLSASSKAYTAKESRTGQLCRWRSDWWIPFDLLEPSPVPLVVLRQIYVEELQHDRDGPYIAQGSRQGNRTESACTWIYFQGKHTTGSTTWQHHLIGLHLQTFSLLIQDAAN